MISPNPAFEVALPARQPAPVLAETHPHPLAGGAPLRCHRAMPVQPLQVGTPVSILGAALMALLSLPRAAILAPAMIRITRSRRA